MGEICSTYTVSAADRLGIGRLLRSAPSLGADIQGRLYAQLGGSPAAALMGSLCALVVLAVAIYRSSAPVFVVFVALEVVLAFARIAEAALSSEGNVGSLTQLHQWSLWRVECGGQWPRPKISQNNAKMQENNTKMEKNNTKTSPKKPLQIRNTL